jgi:hypothetical protein
MFQRFCTIGTQIGAMLPRQKRQPSENHIATLEKSLTTVTFLCLVHDRHNQYIADAALTL